MKRSDLLRIAIDGPVGAGKTSVGRLVARRLGIRFLDTGLTYRALAFVAVQRGVPVEDPDAVRRVAAQAEIDIANGADGEPRVLVDGEDVTDGLRSAEVDRLVSVVAAMPEVRTRMVEVQRRIAAASSIVMVGRDIGTVVLPDADLKIYLTAGDETRARRRYDELRSAGTSTTYEGVLDALRRRDRIDSQREASPLRAAEGAKTIATDNMTLQEVVSTIADMALAEMASWR